MQVTKPVLALRCVCLFEFGSFTERSIVLMLMLNLKLCGMMASRWSLEIDRKGHYETLGLRYRIIYYLRDVENPYKVSD